MGFRLVSLDGSWLRYLANSIEDCEKLVRLGLYFGEVVWVSNDEISNVLGTIILLEDLEELYLNFGSCSFFTNEDLEELMDSY